MGLPRRGKAPARRKRKPHRVTFPETCRGPGRSATQARPPTRVPRKACAEVHSPARLSSPGPPLTFRREE